MVTTDKLSGHNAKYAHGISKAQSVGEGGPPGDNFHKIGVIMLKKDGTYANSC